MILLLTGCINPNGMKYTALQDPFIREKQYVEAINYYLENTTFKIVFCENSNCLHFADYFIREQQNDRYEYLTFDGNNYDKNRGKGFGEAMIISYAFEHSRLLQECEGLIVKITGRIIIRNINKLLRNCHPDRVYANFFLRSKFCGSQFVVAPYSFYKFFLADIDRINDSEKFYFEHLLYEKIIEWKGLNHKHSFFIYPILKEGISGTTGRKLSNDSHPYLKAFLKYLFFTYIYKIT